MQGVFGKRILLLEFLGLKKGSTHSLSHVLKFEKRLNLLGCISVIIKTQNASSKGVKKFADN
ncbi:hypothetical protein GCM10009096_16110 [Parasphingorhabdus litoris]|uniref:Uncharacterized protein n=1 Tax=Parasphingorhabdus litoris TaxID=394733 RepID=A0ABN1AFL1_9SPHN